MSKTWHKTDFKGLIKGDYNNITLKTSLAILFLVLSIAASATSQTQVIGFDVEDFNIGNMLKWQTTVEVDNKEFVIERSTDGVTFTIAIGS